MWHNTLPTQAKKEVLYSVFSPHYKDYIFFYTGLRLLLSVEIQTDTGPVIQYLLQTSCVRRQQIN